jgi:signal transduction histidine kinase
VKDELQESLTGIHGTIQVGPMPQHVRAVPYQIRQLFTNLLSNSIKFAQKDTPLIIYVNCLTTHGRDVTDVALPQDQVFYCITVKDNGIGFDNSFRQRLFDIFFRLHTAEEYTGTGIGLAICKKIAENHQGVITASSKPGEGALFSIYLPV